jgi:aspartate aminotransferase-like enzyme
MINHRGPEFADIQGRIMERLKTFFRTKNDVYIVTGSGTSVMEASVVNTLSPGDHVLCVSIGEFGERFADIAAAFGAAINKLDFEPGTSADPAAVAEALAADPEIKAVLVTHNETSTGVTNDVRAIGKAIRAVNPEILYIVDAISSLGCLPFDTDGWGVDVATTCSQKGFMIPPGLAFITLSDRAWAAYETAKMPRYYFDVAKYRDYAKRGQPPFTPAVSLYYGLDKALDMMAEEGFEQTQARHHHIGEYTRAKARALGLQMLAEGPEASDTVTSVRMPEGIAAGDLLKILNSEYDTVLAAGQGKLMGKIFRIGHMGICSFTDLAACFTGIEGALAAMGHKFERGAAVAEVAQRA